MQNLPIYLIITLFLALTARALLRRNHPDYRAYRTYLMLLVPTLILPIVAVIIGADHLPKHEVVIHGYRVPLDADHQKIYIGSDARDDLILHHRIKDRETIERSLVEVAFSGTSKEKRISQTSIATTNIVSVDGMPLRALSLEAGKTHRISFGAFGYSEAPKDVLELSIPSVRVLAGDLAWARPEFTFRGQNYSAGFSHEVAWGILPNIATKSGQMRHLAWRKRIFHKALDGVEGSLLKQAAIMRKGNEYYLLAGDADIRLDGQPFPNSMTTSGSSLIKIESLQIGSNRFATQMKLVPPNGKNKAAYLELLPQERRRIKLPPISVADRLCLSANPSSFSQAYDIIDDQFPTRGMIISRERDRFVFRGNTLEAGEPYACGKVVFSIEEVDTRSLMLPVLYGVLFLLSALFVPRSTLRQVPILGPLVAIALFLHGLRQMIAFRAWQGPPYNFNVFLDSAAAPFLLVLSIVVLVSREPFYDLVRSGLVRVWNFAFPTRGRALRPPKDGDGGKGTLALLLYGGVLYLCFSRWLGSNFLMSIAFFAILSILLGGLARFERRLGAQPLLATRMGRYMPVLSLLALFVVAAISAPLLGGREIIPFLPGRLRPDIAIQLVLLVIVAYQAGLWERDRHNRVTRLGSVLLVYVAIFVLPLTQGILARDMGFFLVAACPLMTVLLMASWSLDRRIVALFFLSLTLVIAVPIIFRLQNFSLDGVAAQRIAFWVDKPRLRAEHFFDYQAQVPILWSSAQGLFGGGFFSGDWYPALRGTAVNDNVASVFVQGELGGIGSFLIMGIYALFSLVGVLFVRDNRERLGGFRIWLVMGIALTFMWTATAMFLQNLGYMPLTGKNLPFLGLDSLNDTIRYGLLTGLMARYIRELEE